MDKYKWKELKTTFNKNPNSFLIEFLGLKLTWYQKIYLFIIWKLRNLLKRRNHD